MEPDLKRFLDAAIAKRRIHALHLLVSRAVLEASPSEVARSLEAREEIAMKCTDADTEFDMAFKLITDPYIP